MSEKETLIEIAKLAISTDGSGDSAYERLRDIFEIALTTLKNIDPSFDEENELD